MRLADAAVMTMAVTSVLFALSMILREHMIAAHRRCAVWAEAAIGVSLWRMR
jgi:hypothetical protein